MKSWKVVILVSYLTIAGCSGLSNLGGNSDASKSGLDGADGSDVSTFGNDNSAGSSGVAMGGDGISLVINDRIIYFAFDSSTLDDASTDLLKQHGQYLADNPNESARLEGHADERGSREYNLGLGDRRAASVQSLLLAQGASQSQLSTVSFGEERPVDAGSDEMSYAKNRRVEVVYGR